MMISSEGRIRSTRRCMRSWACRSGSWRLLLIRGTGQLSSTRWSWRRPWILEIFWSRRELNHMALIKRCKLIIGIISRMPSPMLLMWMVSCSLALAMTMAWTTRMRGGAAGIKLEMLHSKVEILNSVEANRWIVILLAAPFFKRKRMIERLE